MHKNALNRARRRERFETLVNESAGAILTQNPDVTPGELIAEIGCYFDSGLIGGMGKSPIFRAAVIKRIKALTHYGADCSFDPEELEREPVTPPRAPRVKQAPELKPEEVPGAIVKAWEALKKSDPFADSLIRFYRARGFLSARQLWHLGNLVDRETARRAYLAGRAA